MSWGRWDVSWDSFWVSVYGYQEGMFQEWFCMVDVAIPMGVMVLLLVILYFVDIEYRLDLILQILTNSKPPYHSSCYSLNLCDSRMAFVQFFLLLSLSPCWRNHHSPTTENAVMFYRKFHLRQLYGTTFSCILMSHTVWDKIFLYPNVTWPTLVNVLSDSRQNRVTIRPILDLSGLYWSALECFHHADNVWWNWDDCWCVWQW